MNPVGLGGVDSPIVESGRTPELAIKSSSDVPTFLVNSGSKNSDAP